MAGTIAKIGRGLGKVAGWLVAVALLLIVAAQIGFWCFTAWLATPPGGQWLTRTADRAMQASGYKVALDGVHWYGLTAIRIDRLTVADRQGVFASADGLSVSAGLGSAMTTHVLPVAVTADAVHLSRLPASDPQAPKKPYDGQILAPFQFKPPFVRTVELRRLAVGSLTLDAPVAGTAMQLSPDLTATLTMAENALSFELTGTTGAADTIPWLPGHLALLAKVKTDRAELTLSKLAIDAPALSAAGNGTAGLNKGPLNLALRAQTDALYALSNGKVGGTARLDAGLGGTTVDPAAALNGIVDLTSLADRGLGPIELKGDARHLLGAAAGNLAVATRYKTRPATLTTAWRHDGSVVALDALKADAPDLSIAGDLAYDLKSKLGQGKVTAQVTLDSYRDLLKADVRGKAKATVKLAATDGKQAVAVDAKAMGVRYQTISVGSAALSAAIADLKTPLPQTAALQVANARVGDIAINRLTAGVKQADAGQYALDLDGAGRLRQPFTLTGAAMLSGHDATDAAARGILLNFKTGKGGATVKGDVLPDRLAVVATLAKLPLAALPAKLPDAAVGLTVGGKVTLDGLLADPVAKADLAFSRIAARKGLPAIAIKLAAAYTRGRAEAHVTGTGRGIDALKANVAVPIAVSIKPFKFALDKSSPLRGDILARLNVDALAPALLPPEYLLTGRLDANGAIGGTVGKPVIGGDAVFAHGRFVSQRDNVALDGIGLRAGFRNNVLALGSLHATDGKAGAIDAHGTLNIAHKNAADFAIAVRDLDPFTSVSQVTGTVSADLALKGAGNAYAVTGKVNPGEFDVTVPERFVNKIPQLNIVDPRATKTKDSTLLQSIALNIAVHAPNRIFVRGWGLDAEFGGDLTIHNTAATPLIDGNLASIRGRYEEFNKRFDLNRANLRFQGPTPPSPYLDIEAQTKTDDITAIIDLTGPVKDPKIALSSTPALPQDEVLSHLLFGKDMNNISPFQAIQLASTIQRFTGHGGGPGLLDNLRSRTGLDDISVDNSSTGDTTVGAGKYITDKVYVQVEGGSAKNSGAANVQYQLTPHVTVNSKVSQDAQAGGGISWSWDY